MSWMNCLLSAEEQKVESLFHADDMILLSRSKNGLITVRKKLAQDELF